MVAEDLLRAEGFTEIRYVEAPESFTIPQLVARGDVHFANTFAGTLVSHMDNGLPITALSGVHSGCYELFAHEPIRTISELRGKRVAIQDLNSDGHYYLAIMAAHVGLDPQQDFNWVTSPDGKPMELFAEGKADAFLGFPARAQELSARTSVACIHQHGPGQALVAVPLLHAVQQHANSSATSDRDQACLRAVLKAADFCADEPERAARRLVDAGFPAVRVCAPDANRDPYRAWRELRPGGHACASTRCACTRRA